MLFACFLHLSLDERIPQIRSLKYIYIYILLQRGCTLKNPLSIALDRRVTKAKIHDGYSVSVY